MHKFLMGERWNELPAETVLDHKVSVAIGSTLVAEMIIIGVLVSVIYVQNLHIKDLKK